MIKKLLATPCLLGLLFGCGKKIENSNEDESIVRRDALEAQSILVTINTQTTQQKLYTSSVVLPSDGWAKIPENPIVISNNATSFKTKIYFNTSELSMMSHQVEEIFCEYQSIKQVTHTEDPSHDGYRHDFQGCFTYIDGLKEDVNYTPGQEFPFNKGKLIKMEISSDKSTGRIQIHSDIDVDWH